MGVLQTIVSIAAGIVTVILALPIIVKAALDFFKGIRANNKLSFPKLNLPSSGIITNLLLLLILSLTLASLVLRLLAPTQQVSNPQSNNTVGTSANSTPTLVDTLTATPTTCNYPLWIGTDSGTQVQAKLINISKYNGYSKWQFYFYNNSGNAVNDLQFKQLEIADKNGNKYQWKNQIGAWSMGIDQPTYQVATFDMVPQQDMQYYLERCT